MRHQDIKEGDVLKLKKDNVYGLGPLEITVTQFTYRPGYKEPFVWGIGAFGEHTPGAFRAKDFSGHV